MMDEDKLANAYLRSITKFIDDITQGRILSSQTEIWELSKRLAKMAQPRKNYQDLYNSPESREERKKIKNKQNENFNRDSRSAN